LLVIEQIMLFGIGFLAASLFNLILVPLVHNRAVRLTMRRLEASTPFSMAEIQAEKDQLRAEFAMSTRRLEMSVEQLKAKTTAQLSELGKKSMAIDKLKHELNEKAATVLALESRESTTREQLRTTEQEYSLKSNKIQDLEHALAGKEAELGKLTAALNERAVAGDSQRVEIAAMKTQIEQMKAQLDRAEKDLKETGQRRDQDHKAAEAAASELAQERAKATNFSNRIALLERQLVGQTTEAEVLGKRVQELEQRLTEQGRMLVEREYDARKFRGDADRVEALKAEKQQLAQERDQLREENARLKREAGALMQGAESAWANERVENALLRERINDIAAEVARLTLALEGPGSPIETLLAGESSIGLAPASGVNGAPNGEPAAPSHGDLVERIRALKSRASRFPATP
jgi:chromosome segregation ATPase